MNTTREIYWDKSDPQNIGPAYRDCDESGREIESGALEFIGWSNGAEYLDGYNLGDYFDGDGAYLGPDSDGIEPVLVGQ